MLFHTSDLGRVLDADWVSLDRASGPRASYLIDADSLSLARRAPTRDAFLQALLAACAACGGRRLPRFTTRELDELKKSLGAST